MDLGPFAVLHAMLDRVIDGYIAVATVLELEVASLESKVFSGKRQTFSHDICFLKREFIEFRHAIEPLMLPVQKVSGENFCLGYPCCRPNYDRGNDFANFLPFQKI